MHLTFQCNQTAAANQSLGASRISAAAAAAATVKQFPENGLLFNVLTIHMEELLLPTGIIPSYSIPAAPGAEMLPLNESFDYCLAIT